MLTLRPSTSKTSKSGHRMVIGRANVTSEVKSASNGEHVLPRDNWTLTVSRVYTRMHANGELARRQVQELIQFTLALN